MPAVLAAHDVHFSYDGHPVLSGITFAVEPGAFVALAGPNGSGKSTLVRILVGLLRPTGGSATVLGSAPGQLRDRWRLGYVPQRPATAAGLPATVDEVVGAGRLVRTGWRGRIRAEDERNIRHALESVGMLDSRHRRYADLSGGQQQRVLIAKALAGEPEVLILDEPTAGVDAESQRLFRDALVHLVAEHRAAILLVSHELSAVADDLDRVIVVRHGQVAFDGAPDELTRTGVSLGVHASDLPVWLEDGSA